MLGSQGRMLVSGGAGLLVSHLGGRPGQVLVHAGDHSGDEHGWLGGAGAFPFPVVRPNAGVSARCASRQLSHEDTGQAGRATGPGGG